MIQHSYFCQAFFSHLILGEALHIIAARQKKSVIFVINSYAVKMLVFIFWALIN